MNSPNPALVTQRAVQRLPRLALVLFCAAYVVPGLFGRDPWRNADITAFGYMLSLAEGRSAGFLPMLGGVPSPGALLPYWLGALFVDLLGGWLGPALAARIPFALLLVATLVLVWYSTYHLARTEAAQPLPFAFGGEADPVDYARAIADGALLALIATLGLLQLGHETTPELAQLASVALLLYALSATPFRGWTSKVAVLAALPALAASGAPAIAVALGAVGVVVCVRSEHPAARRFVGWVVASTVLAAGAAALLGAWGWRVSVLPGPDRTVSIVKLFAWFMWPAWLLALWTLWRWRRQWQRRHIAVPLGSALVSIVASVVMGGSDRALMLALPPLAVLASFALPTLQRSTAAAVDWFSVFFFSVCALAIWVIYVAIQTGVPRQPAANVAKLVPGFVPSFSPGTLGVAIAGTAAWLWLVRWRTGRHRHALWKSLVLPASGVALCWLLLMTLWLPLLDYVRSYRALIERLAPHVTEAGCVAASRLPTGQIAALEHYGGYRVDAASTPATTACEVLLRVEPIDRAMPPPPGWVRVAQARRPNDRDEVTAVYRRAVR